MVDRVAIDGAVLGPEILVLPIVILDRDREADGGEAELLEGDMIAAAAEPVGAPDLADVEAEREIARRDVSTKRDRLRDGELFSPPRLRCWATSSSVASRRTPSESTRTWLSSQIPSEPQLLPIMSLLRFASTCQPWARA